MSRSTVLVLTAVLVCGGYACGSSPAAPSSQNTTFAGTIWVSDSQVFQPITVTKSGTMTVTLTWPSTTADLDLWLTDSSCSYLDVRNCPDLGHSTHSGAGPETLTRTVTAGQTYRAWVVFWTGAPTEYSSTYTLQVTIP